MYVSFGQCIWRKVQDLRGTQRYRDDEEFRRYIRKCAALTFVPLARLDDAWVDLQAEAPADQLSINFTDYFVNTWLDDIAGRFSRTMWNHHENMKQDSIRTNNSLEVWHRHLKGLVSSSHPNMYKIVRELRTEQERIEQEMRALVQGQQTRPPRKVAVRHKNLRLERTKQSFDRGDLSLMDLLTACAYAVHLS